MIFWICLAVVLTGFLALPAKEVPGMLLLIAISLPFVLAFGALMSALF